MTLLSSNASTPYRGRIAPSPTGLLHLGHARTFWIAQERARAANGALILRNEDLDVARCRSEFVAAMFEDLRWFGFDWDEGPDVGGSLGPYSQSERHPFYAVAFEQLRAGGFIYPCDCSRKDVLAATSAPHAGDEEPIYPGTCRSEADPWDKRYASWQCGISQNASPSPPSAGERVGVRGQGRTGIDDDVALPNARTPHSGSLAFRSGEGIGSAGALNRTISPRGNKINWRFRVPDGETVAFIDGCFGVREFVAGRDFGDFVVWRHDDIPAYQLAVVVDDHAMRITEVVRGGDLLVSTARQILLYRALGHEPPKFYHCPLMLDENGVRLAKRHDASSLRVMRERGLLSDTLRRNW